MLKNEYYKMYQFENTYWWYRGLHELIRHFVTKRKRSHSGEPLKIFDAGCGTGRMMELLKPLGMVEGIDYSADAVALCRERGLENAREGDLNTWTAPDNSCDIIVSSDVICTSGVEDDLAVVVKFHRALKPGGLMILNLPAFMALRRRHDIAVFGKRRYRKHRTLKKMKEAGFTPIRATYRLPPLFFVMLLQKHLLERFDKEKVESDLKPLPNFLNKLLLWLHRIENRMIAWGVSFPLGSSLFLIMEAAKDAKE